MSATATKEATNFLSDSECADNSEIGEESRFVISHVEAVDKENDEEISPPPKISIEPPESRSIDLFLFHVHEEGEKIYLFGKHKVGKKHVTLCVEVANVFYYLQFLPIPGHEYDIGEEVNDIAHKCGGSLVAKEVKEMLYSFDSPLIPKKAKYLCATFSANSAISRIRQSGKHYSHVFGVTATLTENLFLRRRIYCPSWIRITNCVKNSRLTTVPMLSINNIESISPLYEEISNGSTPPMNLCTISIKSMFQTGEIFMISSRILFEWDIEEFSGKGMKSITYVCSSSGGAVAKDAKENKHFKIFRTEKELLSSFVKLIDDYDIDVLISFGLITSDIPLLFSRLKYRNVDEWWRIGRLRRASKIKDGKINPTYALSGRLPCDIRIAFSDFVKAKSNDLSAAVNAQFGFERQKIDHYEVVTEITEAEKLLNLINFNARDTLFIAQLTNAREILPLSLQIAQISGCQWSKVLLSHTSLLCEAELIRAFHEKGYVLPDKCFTNQSKEPAFPGGLVLQPKRGFYENCIVTLDFVSLYPSLIIEYNICFTTVNLKNPNAEESKKCEEKGVLPQIMENLLSEREKVKKEMKKIIESLDNLESLISKFEQNSTNDHKSDDNNKKRNKDKENQLEKNKVNEVSRPTDIGQIFENSSKFVSKNSKIAQSQYLQELQENQNLNFLKRKKFEMELELQRLNTKQNALKVLANGMYGYLGYRHSRFLANSLAALIAQKGREILQQTVEIVEQKGKYAIIYGDTDSIMIDSGTKTPEKALRIGKKLAEVVTKNFNHLKFGVEGIFLKLLLVQKKRYVALVYDEPGKSHLMTKGIELVRRDWCGLTKYISAFVLEQFMYSDDKDLAITNILKELTRISSMLRNNGIYLSNSLSYSQSSKSNTSNNSSLIEHSDLPKSPVRQLLPTNLFPQIYGNSSQASLQTQTQTQYQTQQKNDLMKLRDLRASNRSSLSILREYGIESKYAPDDNNAVQERVVPLQSITIDHLILHVTLTKPISKYQDRMSPHVMVAQRMVERGEYIAANTTIAYIISNYPSREIGEKARIPDEVNQISECDSEWYLSNQILAPLWRLCEPFGGIDAAMIARAMGLSIPQVYWVPERDECVEFVIPHTTELIYKCSTCNEPIFACKNMKKCLTCSKCGHLHNWKYAANKMTEFLQSYIGKVNILKCEGSICDFQTKQFPIQFLEGFPAHGKCTEKLIPLYNSASIFNTLKYFKTIFEKTNNPEDEEYAEFRDYMKSIIKNFIDCHGFMRIQLSSLFSSSSSSTS